MALSNEGLITLYRNMVRSRALDEVTSRALQAGRLAAFYHSGYGQEAVGVGGATFLRQNDYMLTTHRYPAHVVAKGMNPGEFLAEHYGRVTGCCKGRTGFHSADMKLGMPGMYGTIGSQFPVAAGLGIAAKKRGQGQVVMCFFGDGTANRGTLHEAFLMAANWKLPIVWVCENNQYAMFVHVMNSFPVKDISALAGSYGMPGTVVDGQDVVAVYEATSEAVERARRGEGPSLVECKTYRFGPHFVGIPDLDGAEPRSQEEYERLARDPIALFQEKVLAQGVLTPEMVDQIQKEAEAEMAAAEKFTDESPLPDPGTLFDGLYV